MGQSTQIRGADQRRVASLAPNTYAETLHDLTQLCVSSTWYTPTVAVYKSQKRPGAAHQLAQTMSVGNSGEGSKGIPSAERKSWTGSENEDSVQFEKTEGLERWLRG